MSKKYKQQWRKNVALELSIIADDSADNEVVSDNNDVEMVCDMNVSGIIDSSASEITETVDDMTVRCSDFDVLSETDDEFFDDDNDNNVIDDNDYDDDVDNADEKTDLAQDLAYWATKHKCTQSAVNDLLTILRCHNNNDLPKDVRTLLNTPRDIPVVKKCGGDYYYVGIEKGIVQQLLYMPNHQSREIKLSVNVDGLPLFKSSKTSVWPILGKFDGSSVFTIAAFCGINKPNNCKEFLNDFLEEYKKLEVTGMYFNQVLFHVKIWSILCDAPARQFLKSVKSHIIMDVRDVK